MFVVMRIKHGNLYSMAERNKAVEEPAVLNFRPANVVASNDIHLLTPLPCQN